MGLYKIKTEKSFGVSYLKVSLDDQTHIGMVAPLIQTLDCVKTAIIKECVCESTGLITKFIEVCPDTGVLPCVEENFDVAIRRIQYLLDEIDDEVFEMRGIFLNHLLKPLDIYDKIIRKMMIGEYDKMLIDDMCNLLGILSDDFTNVKVVSSIKQIEIADKKVFFHDEDIHEKVTKLFNAIRVAILVGIN